MRDLRDDELILNEAGPQFEATQDVEIAVRACRAAGNLKQWGKAVAWAERGLQVRVTSPEADGWLHYYLGTALMYTGDLYRSERELTRFLEMVPRVEPLREKEGAAHFNMGYLMRHLNRFSRAIACFETAAAWYEAHDLPVKMLRAQHQIAWTWLLTDRPDAALPYLQTVADGAAGAGDPELAVNLEIAMALYHYQTGNRTESQRLCLALLDMPGLAFTQKADTGWILGCIALAAGDRAAARTYAEMAYEAALEDWWPPQLIRIKTLKDRLSVAR